MSVLYDKIALNTGAVLDYQLYDPTLVNVGLVTDRSKYHNNGTLTGTVLGATGRTFNGLNTQIVPAADASMNIHPASFTILAWHNPSVMDNWAPVFKIDNGNYTTGMQFATNRLLFRDSAANVYTPATGIVVNIWSLSSVVHNLAATQVLVYNNDVLASTTTYAGAGLSVQASNQIIIGATIGGALYYYTGIIGRVLVIPSAFTAEQIRWYYWRTKGFYGL